MPLHSKLLYAGLTGFLYSLFLTVNAQPLEIIHDNTVELTASVNSGAEEIKPLCSPGGDRLFFARVHKNVNNVNHVWYCQGQGGKWEKSKNDLPHLKELGAKMIVGIGDGGKVLYFSSQDQRNSSAKKLHKISYSGSEWSAPEALIIPGLDFSSNFYGFYMAPDEEVLVISMQGEFSYGMEDLYISAKNSKNEWSTPIHLGSKINTPGFETSPFLSEDKKMLFFASNGHGGLGGADIFYSRRLDDNWNNWSTPKNLGNQVNSPFFDAYYSVNEKSKKAYFSSNRGGSSHTNIYSADVRFGKGQAPNLASEGTDSKKTTSTAGILKLDKLPAIAVKLNLMDENEQIISSTTTDDNGYFNFDRFLPDKNYTISINNDDVNLLKESDLYLANDVDDMTVFLNNEGPGLFGFKVLSGERYEDLEEFKKDAQEGKVVDKRSSISGIVSTPGVLKDSLVLNLVDQNEAIIQTIKTDKNGHFKFDSFIPEKNYVISVDASSAGLVDVYEIFLANGTASSEIVMNKTDKHLFEFKALPTARSKELELDEIERLLREDSGLVDKLFPEKTKGKNIVGGILKYDKLPAINVKLKLMDENDNLITSATTDENGYFNFQEFMANQDYQIKVDEEDSELLKKSVLFLTDDVDDMKLYINSKKAGLFAFKALSGERYENLRSLESEINKGKIVEPYTSISGTFNYQQLPKANITLRLVDENDKVLQTTKTDQSGFFEFEGFTINKNYVISVDPEEQGLSDIYEIYLSDPVSKDNSVIIDKVGKYVFAFKVLPTDMFKNLLLEVPDAEMGNNASLRTGNASGPNYLTEFNLNDADFSALDIVLENAKKNKEIILVKLSKHEGDDAKKTHIERINPGQAQGAVDYLESKGISSDRILLKSFGNERIILQILPVK